MDRIPMSDETRVPDGSGTALPTTQARQAMTTGRVRYMLSIGIALVVIAFLVIYFVFARSWHAPFG